MFRFKLLLLFSVILVMHTNAQYIDINTAGGIGQDLDNYLKLKKETDERIYKTLNPHINSFQPTNNKKKKAKTYTVEELDAMLYSGDKYKVENPRKLTP